MVRILLLAILVFGFNFFVWGVAGLMRVTAETPSRLRARWRRMPWQRRLKSVAPRDDVPADSSWPPPDKDGSLTVADVAVLMAAHNEELVIEHAIEAIARLVPVQNIHVVSDGSTDRTVDLALEAGANCLAITGNVGKAGALNQGVQRFRIPERFKVMCLVDADTQLDPRYFAEALPLFRDPKVVAVAGFAQTLWRPRKLTLMGRVLQAHRARIYAVTQRLLKYGQTWRRTNATHIVPGFASLYRTDVLEHIDIDPSGLVIEDFNMTFEVYRHRLGKVGFTMKAVAFTQDPDNLPDYIRQTKRWALGLWQTVRRYRPRLGLFPVMLTLLLIEGITSAFIFVTLPFVVLMLTLAEISPAAVTFHPWVGETYGFVAGHVSLTAILLGVVIPDYLLTCLSAALLRRPGYLVYGLGFLPLRVLDGMLALYSIPRAWLVRSDGRWTSPARRQALVRQAAAAEQAVAAAELAARWQTDEDSDESDDEVPGAAPGIAT